MKKLKLYFIHIWLISLPGFSQLIDKKTDNFWIDGGVGNYYAFDKTYGISYGFSAGLLKNNNFYSLRFINLDELWILGPNPSERFYEAGLLAGKGFYGNVFQVQFMGGLGFCSGYKRGDFLYTDNSGFWSTDYYEKDEFFSPCFPLEINLQLKLIKYVGLGLSFHGNLNLKSPTYGILGKLVIGKLY